MSPLLLAAIGAVLRANRGPGAAPRPGVPSVVVPMTAKDILRMGKRQTGNAPPMPGAPTMTVGAAAPPDTPPSAGTPATAVRPTRTVGGWFDNSIRRRVQITGRRTLGLQFQSVSGDVGAYDSLTNYGQGLSRFTDTGSMQIQGRRVLGFLDFQMNLNDNRFQDPQNQRYTLRYGGKGFDASYGTIQGSLINTNPLVSFTRSLEGASVGYMSGRAQVRALRSEARGSARTVTLEGNNSPGPYYLQAGRIVNDSVRVLLDGKPQRLGMDFTLDSDLGAITFVDRSVPPTSAIVVTYESFGLDTRRGGIQGLGASYDLGRFGRFGFATVRQTSPGSSSTGLRREAFQGFGDPATPYYLQFAPLPGTIQVTVDGIVQVPGVAGAAGGDYAFDPINPVVFYFRRFVPSTQTVIVTYRPKAASTQSGDRSVTGFDYRLPLGSLARRKADPKPELGALVGFVPRGIVPLARGRGTITAAEDALGYGGSFLQAYGATGSTSGGAGGAARGLAAQYDLGGFVFRGAVRDTPASFVSIEQTGFSRNERASEMSVTRRVGAASYLLSTSNAVVFSPSFDASGRPLASSSSRLTETLARASFAPTGGLRWSVEQRRSVADRGIAADGRQRSRLDSTSVTAGRRTGRFGFSTGFDRQSGFGPVTLDGVTTNAPVGIQSVRGSLDYAIGRGLAITGRTSLSDVKSGARSGTGTDTSLSLSLAPVGAWSGAVTLARSDSGALGALSGFAGGFGAGYGQSGFSSSPGLTSGYGGTAVSIFSATSNYRAGERLSLSGRFYDQSSRGSVTSNAATRALGFGATYDLRGGNLFSISLDRSTTRFLAAGATDSGSTTLDAFLSGAPVGPWSYRLGVNSLVSSGGSYAQSSFGLDASLSHRVDDRQRLSFSATLGRTRGYYPQDDNSLAMSYDYRLFGNVGLVAAYRWRALRNFDQTIATGAFRSSGFSLQLAFDFSR